MSARIGALRARVALERPVRSDDGDGGALLSWHRVDWLWAQIRASSGKESLTAAQIAGERVVDIIIRHHPDVQPDCRFCMGERVFDIRAVLDEDGRGQWLRCVCVERGL